MKEVEEEKKVGAELLVIQELLCKNQSLSVQGNGFFFFVSNRLSHTKEKKKKKKVEQQEEEQKKNQSIWN